MMSHCTLDPHPAPGSVGRTAARPFGPLRCAARRWGLIAGLAAAAAGPTLAADAPAERALFRQIYQELVEIDTSNSTGDSTLAARAMARRLLDAGFAEEDMQIIEPTPRKGNLVLRYRGSGEKRPMLLLSHLDVVDARREDWGRDPFKLQESGGYFTARGSIDDKARGAVLVSVLSQLKREGFVPRRDLILALTADEELGEVPSNGVLWLLRHRRGSIDAEFGLNEGAEGELRQDRPFALKVQLAEKIYASYELRTSNPGGHASMPTRSNAIVDLAEALARIARHEFAPNLSDVTRAYFQRLAAITTGPVAADMQAVARAAPAPEAVARLSARPAYNAQMRTTCAATMIEGGHAENALPQSAKAALNCRILPNDDPAAIERTLATLAGDKVTLKRVTPLTSAAPSPMRPDVLAALEAAAGEVWEGVPVIPVMSNGASDSVLLRNAGIPMYGVSGLFIEPGDYRAHGRDERVRVASLYESREFIYRLVRALSR